MPQSVAQRLDAHHRSHRSPLYVWLYENRTEIAAVFAGQSRPGWQALADVAAEAGVRTAAGAKPTGNLVRRMWPFVANRLPAPSQHRVEQQLAPVPAPTPVPTPSADNRPVAVQTTQQPVASHRYAFPVSKLKPNKDV